MQLQLPLPYLNLSSLDALRPSVGLAPGVCQFLSCPWRGTIGHVALSVISPWDVLQQSSVFAPWFIHTCLIYLITPGEDWFQLKRIGKSQ